MTIVPIPTSVPELRQKVDYILKTVWVPPEKPMPNPDDAVLIAAAREFRNLQKLRDRLERARPDHENRRAVFHATERELERLDDRWNALFEFIYQTPAAGLTGAAVKLRLPTDRCIGRSSTARTRSRAKRFAISCGWSSGNCQAFSALAVVAAEPNRPADDDLGAARPQHRGAPLQLHRIRGQVIAATHLAATCERTSASGNPTCGDAGSQA